MDLKEKYIYRPYNPIFPTLFANEKTRIITKLGPDVQIEHIGSTAVPGLGGKGVIDIAVNAPKSSWETIHKHLTELGYEYKQKSAEKENDELFFMTNLPDAELDTRIYHIHLNYPGSKKLDEVLGFRNYLLSHPEAIKQYAEIKQKASQEALKYSTKEEMKETYAKIKKPFIESVLAKMNTQLS